MFPKTGNKRLQTSGDDDFAILMAKALSAELGSTHRAVKTAMRWTGASERTVKHWLAGTHAPRGANLVGLAKHSDTVVSTFLRAAGRDDVTVVIELAALRAKLLELLELTDQILSKTHFAESDGGGR